MSKQVTTANPRFWLIPPEAKIPSGFPGTIQQPEDNWSLLSALMTAKEIGEAVLQLDDTRLSLFVSLQQPLGLEARVIRGFENEKITGQWQHWASYFNVVSAEAVMATRSLSGDPRDVERPEDSADEDGQLRALLDIPAKSLDRAEAQDADQQRKRAAEDAYDEDDED